MQHKRLLFRTRMYAAYGCFEVFDVARGRFSEDLTLTDDDHIVGFARCHSRLWYSVGSVNWNHRLDVWHVPTFEDDPEAERVLCHGLQVTGIAIGVGAFDNEWTVLVGDGEWTVYMLAYNIGVELDFDPELTDDDFLSRLDLARFEIHLARGMPNLEGLIRGPKSMPLTG